MNFTGRWITRNGTLVAVHPLHKATEGDMIQWWGHTIPLDSDVSVYFNWNKNGECVTVGSRMIPSNDPNPSWGDLMERVTGKDRGENSLKVEGCKECENG